MREVMVRAHELARTMEGDYRARMALALRQAWVEVRLIEMGGRRWEKGNMNRIYLNNVAELYGMQVERYNTGNISYAELDGEKISNSHARQLLFELGNAKIWFDCTTGRFASRGLSERARERIMTSVGRRLRMEVAA